MNLMNTHDNYKHLDLGILRHSFDEVTPSHFYWDIFGDDLEPAGVMDYGNGLYCSIAIEFIEREVPDLKAEPLPSGEQPTKKIKIGKKHIITDDLNTIAELELSPNFCIVAPISYAGRKRTSQNARFMYAMCIEVDSLRKTKKNPYQGLDDLIHQCQIGFLPKPTYLVTSGNGIHLYYVFEKPIPMFQNVAKSLEAYKRHITKRMWNKNVTTLYNDKDIQYESIYQAFRMVGSLTKKGLETVDRTKERITMNNDEEVVRAFMFEDGEKVSIEYMNSFVKKRGCEIELIYKSDLTLKKAKELYPEWYERRVVNKDKSIEGWSCKRELYEWWKNKILNEGRVGHRYYCLMILSIYAIKCKENITEEELEADAFEIMEYFDSLTTDKDNHFTEDDVLDALAIYQDKSYITYPINSIIHRSGIPIEKNKRNGRKQKDHLGRIRTMQNYDDPEGDWRNKNGRPKGSGTKHKEIQEWRAANPNGKKAACIKELGLTKPTVYKWWDIPYEETVEEKDIMGYDWDELINELYSDDDNWRDYDENLN